MDLIALANQIAEHLDRGLPFDGPAVAEALRLDVATAETAIAGMKEIA